MGKHCISHSVVKFKEFKTFLTKYNVNEEDLITAFYAWMESKEGKKSIELKKGFDISDSSLPKFLDLYFKVASNNVFDNKIKYEKANTYFNNINSNGLFITKTAAQKRYKSLVEAFGSENVIMYQTPDKKWVVRVAQPILKGSTPIKLDKKFVKNNTVSFTGISTGKKYPIVYGGGRYFSVININGVNVPFYLSSGLGKKKNVKSGKWYPFFGVEVQGMEIKWLNKGSEAQINDFYGSETLKQVSEILNEMYPSNDYSIEKEEGIVTKTGKKGKDVLDINFTDAIDLINKDVTPTSNNTKETAAKVQLNVSKILQALGENNKYEEEVVEDVEELPKELTPLDRATAVVERLKQKAEERIHFDESTHTYRVYNSKAEKDADKRRNKGVVAQSVSGLLGKINIELWGTPSSALGNTVDIVTRDYFTGNLLKSYNNLTKDLLDDIISDLKAFERYLNKKFKGKRGEAYKIFTDEFPIAARKSDGSYLAGTMDMIIADNKGNLYILDMKNKRGGFQREKDLVRYGNQTSLYLSIVETNIQEEDEVQVKGRLIISFNCDYPNPYIYEKDSRGRILKNKDGSFKQHPNPEVAYKASSEKGSLLYLNGEPIQESEKYSSPRLSFEESITEGEDLSDTLIDVSGLIYDIELEALDEEETTIAEEDMQLSKAKINTQPAATSMTYEKSLAKNSKKNSFYSNPLLTASERSFLSGYIMQMFSYIITDLLTNPKANGKYFKNEFAGKDFTSMSRDEIIDLITINKVFAIVKERLYNPKNRSDLLLDANGNFSEKGLLTLEKLQLTYDNFDVLIEAGYSKLISLEDRTIVRAKEEDIKRDMGQDPNLENDNDTGTLEEKEREYWQLGQRQISAKSSLSKEIRRMFEKLKVLDADGKPVKDKYGFGLDTFVDSNTAVNNILEWCNKCTSIEEMEKVLNSKKKYYPYLNTILELIKEEPIRSQFFKNFRKDFTQYSIIRAIKGNDGTTRYVTHIINTKGAVATILDNLENKYAIAEMPNIIKTTDTLTGKGKVNVSKVEEIKRRVTEIRERLNKAHGKKSGEFGNALKNEAKRITDLLNLIGIDVFENTVLQAIENDLKRKNFDNTMNSLKMLLHIEYLTDTLLANKNRTDYNPLEREDEANNVYGDYRSIVNVLGSYIEDSIEASTYEGGKMYYSFVTPSFMGKLMLNLKNSLGDMDKFNKFMEQNYKGYRWFYEEGSAKPWNNTWLELLNTNKKWRDMLDHKVLLTFNKTPYNELSELGYTLSLMHEFFSDRNKEYAWYRVPILSNKPSSEFIKFKRYSGKNWKKDIKNGLTNVFHLELLRMKTVLERATNENISKIGVKDKITYDIDLELLERKKGKEWVRGGTKKGKKVSGLINRIKAGKVTFDDLITIREVSQTKNKKSGAEFHFLEALNDEIKNKTEVGQMILDKINGKDVDENKLRESLIGSDNGKNEDGLVDSYMKQIVDREIKQWEEIGLFEIENTKVESSKESNSYYKYLHLLGKSSEEINESLENYIWNDMFATINIIQLTAVDLAYYTNVEDFQKRYAQVHSPSLRLNLSARDSKGNLASADGKARTVYLKDCIVPSEIKANVRRIFDKKIKELETQAEHAITKEEKNNLNQLKRELELMSLLIVSSFDEINVADAQGYSSPTSYRKKMIMAGLWDSTMEEAYERIRKGNYDINDLGVVWLPLKPFVYSVVKKSSGAKTMSEIPVPVQNKNSEYLLIIADALMRGDGLKGKLQAIFDFMEESAYDERIMKNGKVVKEGTYNGIGIDTVLFESAVNSGSIGAIDLNGIDSYEAIKKELNSKVYYNKYKKGEEANGGDRYNDQVVTTFSFEDYGIQQEVPAHMADHFLAMGSLMRILSISDITDGTVFKVGKNGVSMDKKELITKYNKLIAANIRESFDMLAEEFGLNIEYKNKGRKIRNAALSRILTEAIKKDLRFGADLLRACSLDENGEFIIPPNDPIQSVRIQLLINSIIKSRINKQTVQGGPAVQASVFGTTDDLHIVFADKDGNPLRTKKSDESDEEYMKYLEDNQGSLLHMEVYAPIPSEELEKALTREDGSLMSVLEALDAKIIDEEMLLAIGYRIPTEDKYSMIPMKIKGFLPKAAGEAIMMPKEITLLTGSDFDIDKMYIMFKEFRKVKEVNKRGLKEAVIDAYKKEVGAIIPTVEEYIRKKKIERNKKNNKSELTDEEFEKQLRQEYKKLYGKKKVDPETVKAIRNWVDIFLDEDVSVENDETTATTGKATAGGDELSKILLPIYQNLIDKYSNPKFIKGSSKRDERSKRISERNNEVFDIQWAVLTNEDTMSKMFNPGSFDVQKKSARIIKAIKAIREAGKKVTYADLEKLSLEELDALASKNSKNIIFSTTLVAFHKQNMTAGTLIGIFANNNTSHAFLQMKRIHLLMEDGEAFTIDGHTVSATSNNLLDPLKAFNGSLISKNIAGFLAASVDAVKDPVLNFMNLNSFTASQAMLLARLGFDSDSIGLLLSLPIIEKVTREYFKRNNEGYVSIDSIIKEELENTFPNYSSLAQDLSKVNFSKEDLTKGILKGDAETTDLAMVLLLFKKLSETSKHLDTLTFLTKFNSVTNAAGPTITDTLVMRERYNKFIDLMKTNPPFSPNAAKILDKDNGNDTILSAFFDTTIADEGASKKIFEPFFPHYSSRITGIINNLRKTTKAPLDAKIINKLINDFLFYKLTAGKNPIINTSFANRNDFINNFVARFREEAKGLVDNELIKIISVLARDYKCPVTTLTAKTGGYSADIQEKIKDAWTELMLNPETFELGRDLFIYNLYRNGFNFSPKTFLHLASVDVKLALGDYVEAMRKINFNDNIADDNAFLTMFRRNHSTDPKIVPTLVANKFIEAKVNEPKNKKDPRTLTIKFDNKKRGLEDIIVEKTKISTIVAQVINYDGALYYVANTALNDNSITYREITPLGSKNNFLEYDAEDNAVTMESAIKENQLKKAKNNNIEDNKKAEPKKKKRIIEEEEDKDMTPTSDNFIPENYNLDQEFTDKEWNLLFGEEGGILSEYMEGISEISDTEGDREATSKTLLLIEEKVKTEKSKLTKKRLQTILDRFCH